MLGMHVPNVPLINGVFLQQNQLFPKIYVHCHFMHAILYHPFVLMSNYPDSLKRRLN